MASDKEKSNGSEVKVDPNAWMVTFGDLLMLLLTFFVMLLTMKSMDDKDLKEMFNEFAVSSGPFKYINLPDGGPDIEGTGQFRQTVIQRTEKLEDFMDFVEGTDRYPGPDKQARKFSQVASISKDKRGIVLTLESDYLFDSGSAEITPSKIPILNATGKLLKFAANDILVMGHTDNIPIKKGYIDSNMELSYYRALNVVYYFIDNMSFKPDKITAGGYGEFMPLYPNDTKVHRQKNRRVEFILKNP